MSKKALTHIQGILLAQSWFVFFLSTISGLGLVSLIRKWKIQEHKQLRIGKKFSILVFPPSYILINLENIFATEYFPTILLHYLKLSVILLFPFDCEVNFNKEIQLENTGALNIFAIFIKKSALQGNFLWV